MNKEKDIAGMIYTLVFTILIALLAVGGIGLMLFLPEKQLTVARTKPYSVRDEIKEGDTRFSIKLPPQVRQKNISVSELEDQPYRGFEVRINGFLETDLLEHPLSGSLDAIEDVLYSRVGRESIFTITTEDMREISYEVNDGRLDILLRTPAEIYDHIIVIDAGHGGSDTGYVSGEDKEKDITLEIVEKLRPLFDGDEDIKVFYTRLSDEDIPDTARVGFANEMGADLFLTIHLSSTASGRTSMIGGVSAYYKTGDKDSERFAKKCLKQILGATEALDKGLKSGDDDLLVRLSEVPAAKVECGFITNEDELASLKSDEYQDAIAHALYDAIKDSLKK